MAVTREQGAVLTGVIKRYSIKSGYGFITVDDGGEDCFMHQSEIKTEGFRALIEGDKVEFVFSWRNGRPTGTKVRLRDGAESRTFKSKMEAMQVAEGPTTTSTGPRVIGTCKWFNAEKGYGFLLRDDVKDNTDIFVHINEVKGEAVMTEGQKYQFDLIEENGRFNAANVVRIIEPTQVQFTPYTTYVSSHPQFTSYGHSAPSPAPRPQYNASYSPPLSALGQSAAELKRGKIKFYNRTKGFGFLFPDEGGNELYVGKVGLGADTTPELLEEGTPVEYTTQSGSDGKTWATCVRLVGRPVQLPIGTHDKKTYPTISKRKSYHDPSAMIPLPTLASLPHTSLGYSQATSAPDRTKPYTLSGGHTTILHARPNVTPPY